MSPLNYADLLLGRRHPGGLRRSPRGVNLDEPYAMVTVLDPDWDDETCVTLVTVKPKGKEPV